MLPFSNPGPWAHELQTISNRIPNMKLLELNKQSKLKHVIKSSLNTISIGLNWSLWVLESRLF